MVEGDAIDLGRRLAQELGARCHAHEKFQTAVVKGVDPRGRELRIDVATARTEFYGSPGALPEVERSTLRHDLGRRDFTINAMASSLKAEDLGATYDFFGGYRDLRRGTVRVLHNLSFVEDPTRLLRAVRYESRLGFRMDAHTLSLAKGCIDMRLVGDLSSARLRDELLVILDEPQVAAALGRMSEIGLDRALHPHLDAGPRAVALVTSANRVMAKPPFSAARATLVRLACMCMPMPPHELYGWLERLKLRRRDQDVVAAAVTLTPAIVERLSGTAPPPPSELHELLAGQALEVLVLAAATADSPLVEERLRTYLQRIHEVRLEISGDDLRAAGVSESPAIGAALKQTLELKLDGFVTGREEELRTALRLLGVTQSR
jgi:tRNA nucleotidyltransferase (CCA-adding enzyme)